MPELLDLLKKSPLLFLFFIVVMVAKVYFDKRIEGLADEIAEVGKTSLAVKQQLREQEGKELLAFREAVARWEYYLQNETSTLPDLLMRDDGMNSFYSKEGELFLGVNITSVRLRTLIRDKQLSQQVLDITVKLREAYHPLITELINTLIDLNVELIPIEEKLQTFLKQDPDNIKVIFTPDERKQRLALLQQRVSAYQAFTEKMLIEYKALSAQMEDLNEAINAYIYRPIQNVEVNTE